MVEQRNIKPCTMHGHVNCYECISTYIFGWLDRRKAMPRTVAEDLVEALKVIAAGRRMAIYLQSNPTLLAHEYKILQDYVGAAENILNKYPNVKGL